MVSKSSLHKEILHLFGAMEDHKAVEIIDLQPSPAELEVAAAYVAGMSDIMGKSRQPLAGKAAQIYDIVRRDEFLPDEEVRTA